MILEAPWQRGGFGAYAASFGRALDPEVSQNAGLASDPGSYNDLNGALTEFDNAYNVELYSLSNSGALDTNVGDYIQNNALDHALTLGSTTDAFDYLYLYNFAIGDLSGFFDTNLSFLDITPPV